MKVYSLYVFIVFWCFWDVMIFGEYNLKMDYMNMDMISYRTLGIIWKMRTLFMGCRMMMFWGLFWFTVLMMFILMLTRFFAWFSTLKYREMTMDVQEPTNLLVHTAKASAVSESLNKKPTMKRVSWFHLNFCVWWLIFNKVHLYGWFSYIFFLTTVFDIC
jgi:hypothetical protein